MTALVDSSVWIEFLDRHNPLIRADLVELLRRGEVATSGLVRAELRRGAGSAAQVRGILRAMESLIYFETEQTTWLRAGEIAAEGAARGHQLDVGDCLLAALAFREGCSIFTLDRDFERIPGLKLYRAKVN